MKRNPRKLRWTKSFRKAHGKEMQVTDDSSLQFAARRNIPVRYDRELVETTLKSMERVQEIRQKRERQFYKQRMAGNKARQLAEDKKLVEENQHLLPPSERYSYQPLEQNDELEDEIPLDQTVQKTLDMDVDMDDEESPFGSESEMESEVDSEEEIVQKAKSKAKKKGGGKRKKL